MFGFSRIRLLFNAYRTDREYRNKTSVLLSACIDDLSKNIIKARINYYSNILAVLQKRLPFIKEPYLRFFRKIKKLQHPDFFMFSLEKFWGKKKIVVCGENDDHTYTIELLKNSKWRDYYRDIGSDYELIKYLGDDEVLIPASLHQIDKLISKARKYSTSVTIEKPDGFLLNAIYGNQYFDVFTPKPNEVIIDCGAFDGTTELDFIKWGNGNVKKIYAFELDLFNAQKCTLFYKEHKIEDLVKLINQGTSNKNIDVQIQSGEQGSTSSRIGTGECSAKICRIDDVIKEKVTFIKMDVEGAELESLQGAESIIKKYRPRLAICIYHKKEDLIDIPTFLLSIVPYYRFIVRHYNAKPWETVLYAYTEQ